jgi:hypothetical protein
LESARGVNTAPRMKKLALLMLAACSGQVRTVALSNFQDGALSVFVSNGTVRLYLADQVHRAGLGCLNIEDRVTATVDGAPVPFVSRGRFVGSDTVGEAASCDVPEADFQASGLGATTDVVVTDGTARFEAVFQQLGADRHFTLASPVHPGEDAVFEWSVASDSVDQHPGVSFIMASGRGFAVGQEEGRGDTTQVQGTTMHAQIPTDAPLGAGQFLFNEYGTPAVSTCTGIDSCSANAVRPPSLDADITSR